MKEFGTLKELDVRPGDVVQYKDRGRFTVEEEKCLKSHQTGVSSKYDFWGQCSDFHIVSRASDNHKLSESKPRLWRNMTDAEKGALLLAHHERKVIEVCNETWNKNFWLAVTSPSWAESSAYRVRPEPKVETVTINYLEVVTDVLKDHHITFNLINGKPDCASIKMEKL